MFRSKLAPKMKWDHKIYPKIIMYLFEVFGYIYIYIYSWPCLASEASESGFGSIYIYIAKWTPSNTSFSHGFVLWFLAALKEVIKVEAPEAFRRTPMTITSVQASTDREPMFLYAQNVLISAIRRQRVDFPQSQEVVYMQDRFLAHDSGYPGAKLIHARAHWGKPAMPFIVCIYTHVYIYIYIYARVFYSLGLGYWLNCVQAAQDMFRKRHIQTFGKPPPTKETPHPHALLQSGSR